MSTIRCIYTVAPNFPATDQHPNAVRYQIGNLFVDAIGGQPTQQEIDDVVSPSVDVKAAIAVDSIDRLSFEVNFDQENRIRVLEGKPTITRVQYRTALINAWKAL